MKLDPTYPNTQAALDVLKKLPLPTLEASAEALAAAEALSDLKRSEVDRTAYVDHRQFRSGEAIVVNHPALKVAAAANLGKEKILVEQALTDIKKFIALGQNVDPSLGQAIEKLPSSGIDVLGLLYKSSVNDHDLRTEARSSIQEKLDLSPEETSRLMTLLGQFGRPHYEAETELSAAKKGEFVASLTDIAANLAAAVERRLKDGSLDFEAYDRMKGYVESLPSGYDLDNKDTRKLSAAAEIILNSKTHGVPSLQTLHKGVIALLSAIKKDLGYRAGDKIMVSEGKATPPAPSGSSWVLIAGPGEWDPFKESTYVLKKHETEMGMK